MRLRDNAGTHVARQWQSRLPARLDDPREPTYWLLAAGFVALYVLLERLTLVYELDGLGITLWSPSTGVILVLLLLGGLAFAPFVFVATLLTQLAVYSGPRGIVGPLGTSLLQMVAYSALALALRNSTEFHVRHPRLADVATLLIFVPIGTLLLAGAYCAVLYATGFLSASRFPLAVRNFWIGDTLGIVTLAPIAPVVRSLLLDPPSATSLRPRPTDVVGFVVTLLAALWIIFGVSGANEYQFFYLLFLPVVWISIRAGYAGVAVALLLTHVLLVALATALGYAAYDFIAFQMLMLVLSATGLLLGTVVSERWHSEELVRRQQAELARAVRQATVGALGTAMAHEISQPMSATANYLHAARRILRADGEETGPVGRALEKAEAEAERARMVLERVRDYVSSGRIEVGEIDLEALVGKIASLSSRDAIERGVRIEVDGGPHVPRLQADALQVEQLLFNLIANAVDSASLRGDDRGLVAIRLARNGDRVAVHIDDNGPGIAPEMAERLFEPFETTKPRGMGLGLTLARQIVDLHGGTLGWERLAPQGARFTVELRLDAGSPHDG